MKPVAESSKAADTERFERAVGVWKPADKRKGDAAASPNEQLSTTYPQGNNTMKHETQTCSNCRHFYALLGGQCRGQLPPEDDLLAVVDTSATTPACELFDEGGE